MKLDKNTFKQLHIPTTGMEQFSITYRQFDSLQTEVKSTKFYKDQGQLHQPDDSVETDLVYLIQREDGEVKVVPAGLMGVNAYHILKEHLEPDVKAVVIECRVPKELLINQLENGYLHPETGALVFYAFHHPDWEVRKRLALGLLERENEKEDSSRTH